MACGVASKARVTSDPEARGTIRGMTLLGIDVGGTKVVLVVGDREGRPLARLRRPMSRTGDWRRDVDELIADARRLLADAPGAGAGRQSTLPGFMMLSGSRAALIARMTPVAGPSSFCR